MSARASHYEADPTRHVHLIREGDEAWMPSLVYTLLGGRREGNRGCINRMLNVN